MSGCNKCYSDECYEKTCDGCDGTGDVDGMDCDDCNGEAMDWGFYKCDECGFIEERDEQLNVK